MSGRWAQTGPRRITLVWRNDGGPNAQAMLSRSFQLAREALRGVQRLYVTRALVFVSQANTAIHERALLALSVGGNQGEALGISDPGTQGGALQWTSVTTTLAATGDLGVGSFAFVYQPACGRVLVAEGPSLDVSGLSIQFGFPLLPGLADSSVLQCMLSLEAE